MIFLPNGWISERVPYISLLFFLWHVRIVDLIRSLDSKVREKELSQDTVKQQTVAVENALVGQQSLRKRVESNGRARIDDVVSLSEDDMIGAVEDDFEIYNSCLGK